MGAGGSVRTNSAMNVPIQARIARIGDVVCLRVKRHDIADQMKAERRRTGWSAHFLTWACKKNVVIDDIKHCAAILIEPESLGAPLAVDNVGTRYSGLAYLYRSSIDALILDQSFILLKDE
jgi:EAL domain-containing protein (putative c-di-GMP-specific phosphodiesterase class I)